MNHLRPRPRSAGESHNGRDPSLRKAVDLAHLGRGRDESMENPRRERESLAHPLVRDGQLQKFWASMLEDGPLAGGSVARTLGRPIRPPNSILIGRQDSEREAVERLVAQCDFRALWP